MAYVSLDWKQEIFNFEMIFFKFKRRLLFLVTKPAFQCDGFQPRIAKRRSIRKRLVAGEIPHEQIYSIDHHRLLPFCFEVQLSVFNAHTARHDKRESRSFLRLGGSFFLFARGFFGKGNLFVGKISIVKSTVGFLQQIDDWFFKDKFRDLEASQKERPKLEPELQLLGSEKSIVRKRRTVGDSQIR